MITEPKSFNCLLCRVSYWYDGYISRFAIVGNITSDNPNIKIRKGIWPKLTNVFYDPFVLERNKKLDNLEIK